MSKLTSLIGAGRRAWLALGAVLLLIGGAMGALYFHNASREAQLLRADPDTISQQGDLMDFAVSSGEHVFKENCAACHGGNAQGDRTRGIPDLADNDWLYGTGRVSEIQQTVSYGIRSQDSRGRNLADMPAYARAVPYARDKEIQPLAPDDIRDLLQYLFKKQGRPADEAAAERGLNTFNGRGGCWDCHGDNARGDSAIGASNLTDSIWQYGDGTAADISRSIERGHQGVCPAWTGRISPAQILEVSLYLYAISHPTAKASP